MYGDPQRLCALAVRLDCAAETVRRQAEVMRRDADVTRWESAAADAMRGRAASASRELLGLAERYRDAAFAVRRHAARVGR